MEDIEQAIQQVQALHQSIKQLDAQDVCLKAELVQEASVPDPVWSEAVWRAVPSQSSPDKQQLKNLQQLMSLKAIVATIWTNPCFALKFNIQKSGSDEDAGEVTILEALKGQTVAWKAMEKLVKNARKRTEANELLPSHLRKVRVLKAKDTSDKVAASMDAVSSSHWYMRGKAQHSTHPITIVELFHGLSGGSIPTDAMVSQQGQEQVTLKALQVLVRVQNSQAVAEQLAAAAAQLEVSGGDVSSSKQLLLELEKAGVAVCDECWSYYTGGVDLSLDSPVVATGPLSLATLHTSYGHFPFFMMFHRDHPRVQMLALDVLEHFKTKLDAWQQQQQQQRAHSVSAQKASQQNAAWADGASMLMMQMQNGPQSPKAAWNGGQHTHSRAANGHCNGNASPATPRTFGNHVGNRRMAVVNGNAVNNAGVVMDLSPPGKQNSTPTKSVRTGVAPAAAGKVDSHAPQLEESYLAAVASCLQQAGIDQLQITSGTPVSEQRQQPARAPDTQAGSTKSPHSSQPQISAQTADLQETVKKDALPDDAAGQQDVGPVDLERDRIGMEVSGLLEARLVEEITKQAVLEFCRPAQGRVTGLAAARCSLLVQEFEKWFANAPAEIAAREAREAREAQAAKEAQEAEERRQKEEAALIEKALQERKRAREEAARRKEEEEAERRRQEAEQKRQLEEQERLQREEQQRVEQEEKRKRQEEEERRKQQEEEARLLQQREEQEKAKLESAKQQDELSALVAADTQAEGIACQKPSKRKADDLPVEDAAADTSRKKASGSSSRASGKQEQAQLSQRSQAASHHDKRSTKQSGRGRSRSPVRSPVCTRSGKKVSGQADQERTGKEADGAGRQASGRGTKNSGDRSRSPARRSSRQARSHHASQDRPDSRRTLASRSRSASRNRTSNGRTKRSRSESHGRSRRGRTRSRSRSRDPRSRSRDRRHHNSRQRSPRSLRAPSRQTSHSQRRHRTRSPSSDRSRSRRRSGRKSRSASRDRSHRRRDHGSRRSSRSHSRDRRGRQAAEDKPKDQSVLSVPKAKDAVPPAACNADNKDLTMMQPDVMQEEPVKAEARHDQVECPAHAGRQLPTESELPSANPAQAASVCASPSPNGKRTHRRADAVHQLLESKASVSSQPAGEHGNTSGNPRDNNISEAAAQKSGIPNIVLYPPNDNPTPRMDKPVEDSSRNEGLRQDSSVPGAGPEEPGSSDHSTETTTTSVDMDNTAAQTITPATTQQEIPAAAPEAAPKEVMDTRTNTQRAPESLAKLPIPFGLKRRSARNAATTQLPAQDAALSHPPGIQAPPVQGNGAAKSNIVMVIVQDKIAKTSPVRSLPSVAEAIRAAMKQQGSVPDASQQPQPGVASSLATQSHEASQHAQQQDHSKSAPALPIPVFTRSSRKPPLATLPSQQQATHPLSLTVSVAPSAAATSQKTTQPRSPLETGEAVAEDAHASLANKQAPQATVQEAAVQDTTDKAEIQGTAQAPKPFHVPRQLPMPMSRPRRSASQAIWKDVDEEAPEAKLAKRNSDDSNATKEAQHAGAPGSVTAPDAPSTALPLTEAGGGAGGPDLLCSGKGGLLREPIIPLHPASFSIVDVLKERESAPVGEAAQQSPSKHPKICWRTHQPALVRAVAARMEQLSTQRTQQGVKQVAAPTANALPGSEKALPFQSLLRQALESPNARKSKDRDGAHEGKKARRPGSAPDAAVASKRAKKQHAQHNYAAGLSMSQAVATTPRAVGGSHIMHSNGHLLASPGTEKRKRKHAKNNDTARAMEARHGGTPVRTCLSVHPSTERVVLCLSVTKAKRNPHQPECEPVHESGKEDNTPAVAAVSDSQQSLVVASSEAAVGTDNNKNNNNSADCAEGTQQQPAVGPASSLPLQQPGNATTPSAAAEPADKVPDQCQEDYVEVQIKVSVTIKHEPIVRGSDGHPGRAKELGLGVKRTVSTKVVGSRHVEDGAKQKPANDRRKGLKGAIGEAVRLQMQNAQQGLISGDATDLLTSGRRQRRAQQQPTRFADGQTSDGNATASKQVAVKANGKPPKPLASNLRRVTKPVGPPHDADAPGNNGMATPSESEGPSVSGPRRSCRNPLTTTQQQAVNVVASGEVSDSGNVPKNNNKPIKVTTRKPPLPPSQGGKPNRGNDENSRGQRKSNNTANNDSRKPQPGADQEAVAKTKQQQKQAAPAANAPPVVPLRGPGRGRAAAAQYEAARGQVGLTAPAVTPFALPNSNDGLYQDDGMCARMFDVKAMKEIAQRAKEEAVRREQEAMMAAAVAAAGGRGSGQGRGTVVAAQPQQAVQGRRNRVTLPLYAPQPAPASTSMGLSARRRGGVLPSKQAADGDGGSLPNDDKKWREKFKVLQTVKFGRSNIQGWGMYSTQVIQPDEWIIEYVGEVIRPGPIEDQRERLYREIGLDDYLFRIDENVVVDATRKGNPARFINHSCDPNCKSKIVTRSDGSKHIIIYAIRRIEPGEELNYDYKFQWEEDPARKVRCNCGAKECLGWMC